jgi:hypothetical protein
MTSLLFNEIRRLSRAACLVLACVAALPGCGGEPTEGAEDTADTFTSFEDFEAQTFREPDTGFYIVDGDMVIATRAELIEFYEQHVRGNALTVNTVNGVVPTWNDVDKLNITYCVSTSFGSNYYGVGRLMLDAAAAWSQAANVRFVHLTEQDNNCTVANTKVVFDVRPSVGSAYPARSFFPGDARAKRSLIIDDSAFIPMAPLTLTGLLRHELGHVLGFRHEHTRPQAAKCFEDNNWSAVSSYDPSSVMHYFYCNGANAGDLVLTERDRVGVAALYGQRNGGAKNLAYLKGATQSSIEYNSPASLAVDGTTDGSLNHRSIIHTLKELSPWWKVDLGSVQAVGDVVIHNRTDAGAQLYNFDLLVSRDNVAWRTISYPGLAGERLTLPVNEAERYIKIQLKNNGTPRFLHFAEVEVLQARNLALGRVTSQSTTYNVNGVTAPSSRAVDGNTSGIWANNSIASTTAELSPWWRVDLGAVQAIGDVVLYNRSDCCLDRLSNFTLSVSTDGTTWVDYPYPGIADPVRTRIAVNRPGRHVKVQLNSNGSPTRFLSLAEVEVLAARNLALGKTATQSSTYADEGFAAGASRAIDGDTNGYFGDGSVSHTNNDAQAWWQVDLGSAQSVGEVLIYNRTDAVSERLSNFKLMLSRDGATWTEYLYPGVAGPLTTTIVNTTARYVRVQLNGTNNLQLAEVEVLAQRNFALTMPATQSSTYFHVFAADASRAVDGDTNGDYFGGSVAHTNADAQPWWQVDLGGLRPVREVVLWNRTDSPGAAARLSNFNVLVSEDNVSFKPYLFPGTAGERTSISTRLVGRYVKVQLNGTDNLQLAEVEVNAGN